MQTNHRRVTYSFPSFVQDEYSHLKVEDRFKYLGHIISTVSDDNDDILNQMSLFYARANVLLRRFGKCNVSVKICYCWPTQFYGIALWQRYNITVLKETQSCIYIMCQKMDVVIVLQLCSLNLVYQHLTLFCTIQNLSLQF